MAVGSVCVPGCCVIQVPLLTWGNPAAHRQGAERGRSHSTGTGRACTRQMINLLRSLASSSVLSEGVINCLLSVQAVDSGRYGETG